LDQANNSRHASAEAVMLVADAVDATLKIKGYKEGAYMNKLRKLQKTI